MRLLPGSVPLVPDPGTARGWLRDELSHQAYQAARPTPLDLASQAFFSWLARLFTPTSDPTPVVLLVLALAVLAVLVVVAIVLFGAPRLNRRSAAADGGLFGDDDRRSAAQLRASAAAALAGGDWDLAVLDRFRAVARGLDERTVVAVFPGTTATGFVRAAASSFPAERAALDTAARDFDGVRYAGAAATRSQAQTIADLDDRLRMAKPPLLEAAGA